jgi:Mitochondrial carrier protein
MTPSDTTTTTPASATALLSRSSLKKEKKEENKKGVTGVSLTSRQEIPSIQHPPSTNAYMVLLPREIRNLVAGGVAGMIAKSVVAPLDRIKILYQVSSREFRMKDVPQIATKIIQEEGMHALWKGNIATMIRVFPYSGIQFMVFDHCKTWFLRKHAETNDETRQWGLSPMESLLSGSVAGIFSAACTYPLDLTRAQLAVLKSKKHVANIGFWGVLVMNYKERVGNCVH